MVEESRVVMLKERELYGVMKYYPHNENARLFCAVAKTRTITKDAIEAIKALGYSVVTDRISFEE